MKCLMDIGRYWNKHGRLSPSAQHRVVYEENVQEILGGSAGDL